MTTCPWCNAPRDTAQRCPSCGAIYAKAEAIKSHGRANVAGQPHETRSEESEESVPVEPLVESSLQGISLIEDPVLEWKLCMGAIPIALCFALAFHVFMPFLQRTFLGMPVHELGHAVTAWFCGFVAVPTLWVTHVSETRGFIAPIALLGGLGYLMHTAYRSENKSLVALGGLLVLLLAIGRFGIKSALQNSFSVQALRTAQTQICDLTVVTQPSQIRIRGNKVLAVRACMSHNVPVTR